MPKWLHIILSLSIISLISGFSLAALNNGTKERIEIQVLENKQMPAVKAVLQDASNDLLNDRKKLDVGQKNPVLLFPAKKDGKPYAVALESFGKGFGGTVGVMIGFELNTGKLTGIGITTMSETPGVGTRAKEATFTKQFKGMSTQTVFKVKADGGGVDAVTGATVTSRAVCQALADGIKLFEEHKDEILKAAQ